jgi:hypothetical protein
LTAADHELIAEQRPQRASDVLTAGAVAMAFD